MTEYIRRFYECFYVPEEKLPVHFKVGLIAPSESMADVETLMKQDNTKPVITEEEVLSWFPKSFFEISMLEVGSLVQKLNLMRVTKPINTLSPFKPMEDIFNSLRLLSDQLPTSIKFLENKIEKSSNVPNIPEEGNQLVEHLQKIQQEVTQLQNKGFLVKAKSHLKFWHLDAVIIARQISTYGRFHGKELSFIQSDSKLIKIVKLALERANVINVSEKTIAQALYRFPTEEQMKSRMKYMPNIF